MTDDDLKAMFEALRRDNEAMREENASAHKDTRRHFDLSLEAARHDVRLVAEGVTLTREQLVRTSADLDEKIERTASETQAMIKFSHAELDRRVRALETTQSKLEDALADLQTRVDRLEGSTH